MSTVKTGNKDLLGGQNNSYQDGLCGRGSQILLSQFQRVTKIYIIFLAAFYVSKLL